MARAVAQAAQGGTVLLSEETYKKLPLERLWDKYLVGGQRGEAPAALFSSPNSLFSMSGLRPHNSCVQLKT